jgi:hypothetical protein
VQVAGDQLRPGDGAEQQHQDAQRLRELGVRQHDLAGLRADGHEHHGDDADDADRQPRENLGLEAPAEAERRTQALAVERAEHVPPAEPRTDVPLVSDVVDDAARRVGGDLRHVPPPGR